MRNIIFKTVLFLFFSSFVFSQHRTCGKDLHMQKKLMSPVAKQKHFELQRKFQKELENSNNPESRTAFEPNATIYIPVAVHFPAVSPSSTIIVCLQTLAQNQIDVLNADYNATNSDISRWSPTVRAFYPGTNIGSLNVQFVIATQNHPAGTGLVNGNKAITFGTSFLTADDIDARWRGYMNIVCKDADGALGYSPLGGFPGDGEAVVINFDAFGTGAGCTGYVPSSTYNLGRTLTHELGHFFNLDHTFEACTTVSNCSIAGDLVCDTPASNTPAFGCPAAGQIVSCNVRSLTMNYLDYTDDACMYMFTAGQASRMQAFYNVISNQFSRNALENNTFAGNIFAIFPNPNSGSFTIQMKDIIKTFDLDIYDALGRNVYKKKIEANQGMQSAISIEGQSAGIYFVSVKIADEVFTKKIIIQ